MAHGTLLIGRSDAFLGQLLLGGGDEVPELLVAAGGPHPGPAQAVPKLAGTVTLARVGAAANRWVDGVATRILVAALGGAPLVLRDLGSLGAYPGGGLGDRTGLGETVVRCARLEERSEGAK